MPKMKDPTPSWAKPSEASVFDSLKERALRTIMGLLGSEDPASQVMMMPEMAIPKFASPWSALETGKPIRLNLWRGDGGGGHQLSPRLQTELGRPYLLGEGVYAAPTRQMASAWGEPAPLNIGAESPLVLSDVNGAVLKRLLKDLPKEHDAIAIKSGRWGFGRGQEDLRQIVARPGMGADVSTGHAALQPGLVQPGSVIRIVKIHTAPGFREDLLPLVGQESKVTSMFMGTHPEVRVGGKRITLNPDEVEWVK